MENYLFGMICGVVSLVIVCISTYYITKLLLKYAGSLKFKINLRQGEMEIEKENSKEEIKNTS